MAGQFGEMTWQEELDLLTRFHENNLGTIKEDDNHLENMSSRPLLNDAQPLLPPGGGGRVRSIGRGSKRSTPDDSFIAKQIEEHLGTGHRSESVFSSKTSTKSDAELSSNKTSPLLASTPVKKETRTVTTKPKLRSRYKDTSSEGKQENNNTISNAMPNYLGRGRGRKARDGSAELPVGAVSNMIERNLGQGHRLDITATGNSSSVAQGLSHPKPGNINNNSNNSSYFPKFDYTQVNLGTARDWWGSSQDAASESENKSKSQEKEKQETVKVERAVLSNWTPLDDSV